MFAFYVLLSTIIFSSSSVAVDTVLDTVNVQGNAAQEQGNKPDLLLLKDATVRTSIISSKEIAASGATNV